MKKEQKRYAVDALVHAPWNPRNAAEMDADNPRMKELVASIRAEGLLQPIVVWRADASADAELDAAGIQSRALLAIAGNRRLAACALAGVKEVECVEFADIDLAKAKAITRTENEIRVGISPVKDGRLVTEMLEAGFTETEVAAHFGMSVPMVCRRAKLAGLDETFATFADAHPEAITANALEQIALFPVETQRAQFKAVSRIAERGLARWKDVEWYFTQNLRKIEDAAFDTSACMACPYRTGAQPDLFGDVVEDESPDGLGSCVNAPCWKRKAHEAFVAQARTFAEDHNLALVSGDDFGIKSRWEAIPQRYFKDEYDVRHESVWVMNYYGEDVMVFGPTAEHVRALEAKAEEDARLEAEKDAERAEASLASEARNKELRDAVEEAYRPISEAIGDETDALAKTFAAAFKGRFGFTPAQSSALGRAIAAAFGRYFYSSLDRDDRVAFLAAFPNVAEALGLTPAALNAYRRAAKQLQKFLKENEEK